MAQLKGDYRKTETYSKADKAARQKYEAWKKAMKLDDEAMYLYLEREDMRALPKETIRKGNRQAETMVLSAMAVFLVGAASQKTPLMLLGAVFVIGTSIIYFTGAFNPYT